MQKSRKTLILSVLMIASLIGGTVFAAGFGAGAPGEGRTDRPGGGRGPGLLMRHLFANQAAEVLAEITGQPAETFRQKIQDRQLRAVFAEHRIDREAFRGAMREKSVVRLRQITEIGMITPEQEKEILARMEGNTERRALMRRLIEKGLEDGTITPEQTRMLLKRPR